MVRKILDGISVASFLISSTILLGGGYVYMRRADFVNGMMIKIQDQMVDIIQHQIKQQIKIPSNTGNVLPF